MREISLHILDLIENSLRARASIIAVTVAATPEQDLLRIAVEDNGSGLQVPPVAASDPFYTTKSGKRTGLGLSLLRAAAEQAGGRLTLGKSELGGVAVVAEFGLSHVDRNPLGDLATTLASVVCTNPAIDFRFRIEYGQHQRNIRAQELASEAGGGPVLLAVARRVGEIIQAELSRAPALT